MERRSDFVIKEKMKLLKDSLKRWNKNVFGWNDLKIREGVKGINVVDILLSNILDDYMESLASRRSLASCQMWRNLVIKEKMILQISRVK